MKPKPEPGDLRNRALGYLARREHSRAELTRKLEAGGFDAAEIAPLLDEFEEKNWLSDRRFAESYVADHHAKAGSVKLAYELRQRGVSDAIIKATLKDEQHSELERAWNVWNKKFRTPPSNASERAKQTKFLLSRGFSPDTIHNLLSAGSRQSPPLE